MTFGRSSITFAREQALSGIFISYRRDDSRAWAIWLRDRLTKPFGKQQIFLDVDSLGPGQWRADIERALDRSQAVLVLIGRRWTAADDAGRHRLLEDDDVHRAEIAMALSKSHLLVIPLLVDGASLPRPEHLPDDLKPLLRWQARGISDSTERREADLKGLVDTLWHVTGHTRQRRLALAALAAAVLTATANTLTASSSVLPAVAFLLLGVVILVPSLQIYAQMRRLHMTGTGPALASVILSLAIVIGSIVRLWFLR